MRETRNRISEEGPRDFRLLAIAPEAERGMGAGIRRTPDEESENLRKGAPWRCRDSRRSPDPPEKWLRSRVSWHPVGVFWNRFSQR